MEQQDGSLVLVVYAAVSFYLVISTLASVVFGWMFGAAAGSAVFESMFAVLAVAFAATVVLRRRNAVRATSAKRR